METILKMDYNIDIIPLLMGAKRDIHSGKNLITGKRWFQFEDERGIYIELSEQVGGSWTVKEEQK